MGPGGRRQLLLFWLGSLWLVLLLLRWSALPQGEGFDPGPLWLARIQQLNPLWGVLPLLGLVTTPLLAWRLGWPSGLEKAAPLGDAWLAYLGMHVGAFVWMVPWGWLTPLLQQFVYAIWVGACLWPQRRYLTWNLREGWWRWGLCAYSLALLGALLYAWLVHPAPSANGAVPLLLQAGGWERILWLLLLCLITPVLEESWYRGLLSGPGAPRLTLSALVFGLIHVDPSALPQLIWLGLVFGWARWGGGLTAAVLAHALWNTTVAVYLLGA